MIHTEQIVIPSILPRKMTVRIIRYLVDGQQLIVLPKRGLFHFFQVLSIRAGKCSVAPAAPLPGNFQR